MAVVRSLNIMKIVVALYNIISQIKLNYKNTRVQDI